MQPKKMVGGKGAAHQLSQFTSGGKEAQPPPGIGGAQRLCGAQRSTEGRPEAAGGQCFESFPTLVGFSPYGLPGGRY